MAKKAEKPEAEKSPKQKKLVQIRERCKLAMDADHDNRTEAMADLRFTHVPGEQWDAASKRDRGTRPCYEFNKLRVTIKRVVNDMRANRPAAKIRGVEEGDKDTAEVYEGLFRNIWNVSDADTVIDAAAEYQVGAGMGAWRVNTVYANDSAFELDIKIEGIRNPFNLYADPACQDELKRDARYWILVSRIAKTAFEARWPGKAANDFDADSEFDDQEEWEDEESVRIVEYWYKEPLEKVVVLLSNGKTVDESDVDSMAAAAAEGAVVVRKRKVNSWAIKMCIASGTAILEEADWAGSCFPFVVVYGESLIIEGKPVWFGLPRFAKDAQRAYNYSRTSAIETIALAPQHKFWATPKMAEGHTDKWAEAHKKNFPFMLANPDPQQPGFPQANPGPQVPVALVQQAQIDSEDIKAVTGIFDPSLGQESNETSGKAIIARQRQGEIAVFNYMDNMAKAIRRTAEIVIDLIPKVYDTQRAVRILGVDGAEKYVKVNTPGPDGRVVNDLSRGKYDVTVTTGPSFSTQRQEAAEIYGQMAQANPMVAQFASDLIFKAMDLPYSDKIAERMKIMLPPQIQQAESEQKPMPPEVMAAMAQADAAMQQVQQMAAQVQEEGAKVEGQKADLTKQIAKLSVDSANMKADFERLSAELTKREADLILKEARLGVDQQGQEVANDRESLVGEFQSAAAQLQQQAAEFMSQAAGVIAEIQARSQPQVVNVSPPKSKIVRVKRINGELIGTVEEQQ